MMNNLRITFMVLLGVIAGSIMAQDQKTKPPEADRDRQMCAAELPRGNYDKAIELGQRAVALSPDSARCHYTLANAFALKAQRAGLLKKMSAAKSYLTEIKKVIALNPRHFDARMGLIQFYLNAPWIAGGSVRKAKEHAAQIARISPLHGHLAYGCIYAYEKNFNMAENEFNQAIAIDPQNSDSHFALGIFFIQSKKFDSARNVFNKIILLDPKKTMAYYFLGRIAGSTGKDLQKGLEFLQKYLKTESEENQPTWADAYRRMGNIFEKMGKADQAIAAYEKALRLDPGHEEAKNDLVECKKYFVQ